MFSLYLSNALINLRSSLTPTPPRLYCLYPSPSLSRKKKKIMAMNQPGFLLVAALLAAAVVSPGAGRSLDEAERKAAADDGGAGAGFGIPGWGGGSGFPGIPGGPGWGNAGGGWGAGYGGPGGGYSGGGVVRTSVVCREKGPCYRKRLTCPAKCFSSYSSSGKNYGGGGGGGGCTIDCRKRCAAYC